MVIPECGKQNVHPRVNDDRTAAVRESLIGDDRGEQHLGIVDQHTARFQKQPGARASTHQALIGTFQQRIADGFGVLIDAGHDLLRWQINPLQGIMRGKTTTNIYAFDDTGGFFFHGVHKRTHDAHLCTISPWVQHEGSDMAVQPGELQTGTRCNTPGSVHRLPGLDIETKAAPGFRVAGIKIQSQRNRHLPVSFLGEFFQRIQLIQMIDVNVSAFRNGTLEDLARFVRAIEQNSVARHTHGTGLFILEPGYHFGPRTFLMEGITHGTEVVGFVRPAESHA